MTVDAPPSDPHPRHEPAAADRTGDPDQRSAAEPSVPDGPPPLVDWAETARRVWRSTAVLLAAAVLWWVVHAAVVGAWSWRYLGNWLGLALAAIFLMELLVVGGSALRGMLRAGERGERLSGPDVGILPPVRRRRQGPDVPDDRD